MDLRISHPYNFSVVPNILFHQRAFPLSAIN